MGFIANVLKEHGKELEKLTNEIRQAAKRRGEKGEACSTLERVEEKINKLQYDVRQLTASTSTAPTPAAVTTEPNNNERPKGTSADAQQIRGSKIVVKCNAWEDFQTISAEAESVWFTFMETDKVFEADALKTGQIIAYVGKLPNITPLLKAWLSSQIKVPPERVIEGTIVKP